jgi:hypothetical protein
MTIYTTKAACQLLGRDRKQQEGDIATGHCGHVPASVNGMRHWRDDDLAAELLFMDLRREGYSVKIAGLIATRLRTAMREHPEAAQLTLVTMMNGNRFAVPTADLDLANGWTSGGPVREALMIDVRNLRARISQLLEAYEPVIGGGDDDA